MIFTRKQRLAINSWISQAAPLEGVYFRSVEYRYMDPDDVLSGAGTESYGGRFAAVGMRAVYLSVTDSGATKEVTARKSRLGGAAQISTSKYPRVVYAVAAKLERTLHLSDLVAREAAKTIHSACLAVDDLRPSMDLACILENEGVQALLFPSVIPGGDENLVVYVANCAPHSMTLENEEEVIAQAKKMAEKRS